MKKIMFLFLLVLVFQRSFAQFNGVLHYENDYVDQWFGTKGKVLTTIYESGSNIRIESKDTSFGKTDVTIQNPLLVDINAGTETHLMDKFQRGVVYSISDMDKRTQAMSAQVHTVSTFENLGTEKIGSLNCTHYLMTKSYAKLKTLPPARYDIWITKDLGSCNVWYVGRYLYFFSGMELYNKLANAGANGVVVKWQETEGKNTTSCNLTEYQQENLSSSYFTPPSGYTIVKASDYHLKN